MADNLSSEVRSRVMSAVRSKNTKPEIAVRSALHRKGFRFTLHNKALPGKPDMVLPKYKAVVFIHGCFWHGHKCASYRPARTRAEFWNNKISKNKEKDTQVWESLLKMGWRVAVVWECSLKPTSINGTMEEIASWLRTDKETLEVL